MTYKELKTEYVFALLAIITVVLATMFLGYCIFRILSTGTSQPYWLRGQRRTILADATEDPARGDHAGGFCGVLRNRLSHADQMEPYRGRIVPGGCRVFCIRI